MKKTLAPSILAAGLLTVASASNAALLDFQGWISTYGEQGFDNSAPFTLSDSGLTLTATAYETPGMIDSFVYMDDSFNGIIGGMGVCSALNANAQCINSADDNVSLDGMKAEILSWNFDQSITQMTLELGDSEHYDFNNSGIEYSLDGSIWSLATTDIDGFVTLQLNGSNQIDFRTAGATVQDYFYIRNADVAVVPVPAAALLFGSGLLGLIGIARRRG